MGGGWRDERAPDLREFISPSPGTPGEGWGGGCVERSDSSAKAPTLTLPRSTGGGDKSRCRDPWCAVAVECGTMHLSVLKWHGFLARGRGTQRLSVPENLRFASLLAYLVGVPTKVLEYQDIRVGNPCHERIRPSQCGYWAYYCCIASGRNSCADRRQRQLLIALGPGIQLDVL